MPKGALHIHSTYSDGEFTLGELRNIFREAGCRFACVTDHADWFDPDRLAAYVAECGDLSDDRFRFVPGLEYSCLNRMHVLGYGVTVLIDAVDPQEVIRRIYEHGGLPVIAHPKNEAFGWIRTFDPLPAGIEVWNTKYDGRYAPRPATFALLAELEARRRGMTAYYGQDLHWRNQYRGMFVEVDCRTLDARDLLGALERGDYVAVKDDLRLPSDGRLPAALAARFAQAQQRSQAFRRLVRRAKGWADAIGVAVPAGMKAQLRRMF